MTPPVLREPAERHQPSPVLWPALRRSLESGELQQADALALEPADERDALLTLLEIHDLWMAPLEQLGSRVIHQGHPIVAGLKQRLETWFATDLDRRGPSMVPVGDRPADGAAAAMRRIARRDLVPPIYEWLAEQAPWESVVAYLALEGGPDGGFDDLVALAQVGLHGDPKLALASNYWDEMGRGCLADVHTQLHHRLIQAAGIKSVPRDQQSAAVLERSALNGLLATNRWLQPELLGALGLLEMQAGPRCRAVVRALRRLGAPAGAFPFYEEHAQADPVHGTDVGHDRERSA